MLCLLKPCSFIGIYIIRIINKLYRIVPGLKIKASNQDFDQPRICYCLIVNGDVLHQSSHYKQIKIKSLKIITKRKVTCSPAASNMKCQNNKNQFS